MSNNKEFIISAIVDDKKINSTILYRVRWAGFSNEDDTWENEENIKDKNLIQIYIEKKNELEDRKKRKKKQNMSIIARLTAKKPIRVINAVQSPTTHEVLYRVEFSDGSFSYVQSKYMKIAAPNLILDYLIPKFQLRVVVPNEEVDKFMTPVCTTKKRRGFKS